MQRLTFLRERGGKKKKFIPHVLGLQNLTSRDKYLWSLCQDANYQAAPFWYTTSCMRKATIFLYNYALGFRRYSGTKKGFHLCCHYIISVFFCCFTKLRHFLVITWRSITKHDHILFTRKKEAENQHQRVYIFITSLLKQFQLS